jgi:hypothetical protein
MVDEDNNEGTNHVDGSIDLPVNQLTGRARVRSKRLDGYEPPSDSIEFEFTIRIQS